ncbi:MAG: hypothetical protein ACYCZF_06420 [Anaerolineae bacterium]
MHKHNVRWILMIVFTLLAILPGQAVVLAQQAQVSISAPASNSEVGGVVAIIGSAATANFSFYKLEFGSGANPSSWTDIGTTHDIAVVNGQLETWDTTRLADGVYSLRLRAVKTDGNYDEVFVREISVNNSKATVTPTTTETIATPTKRSTAVVESTAVDGVTPQPTSSLQVIAATKQAGILTPTPTPVRAIARDTLQLDTEGWIQAFIVGASAMGVVFVILGLAFALRRVI